MNLHPINRSSEGKRNEIERQREREINKDSITVTRVS